MDSPTAHDDGNPGQSTAQIDPSNLIVNYLPPIVTQDDLRRLFEPYGVVERCKILVDRKGTTVATGRGSSFKSPVSCVVVLVLAVV